MFCCLIFYILGILAFDKLSVSAAIFGIVFVLVAGIVRLCNARKLPLVLAFFFLFGVCYTAFVNASKTDLVLPALGETVTVEGKIEEVSATDEKAYDRYVLQGTKMIRKDGEREKTEELDLKFDLSLAKYKLKSPPTPYQYGDLISVKAEIGEPSVPLNDGDADYSDSKKAKGIFFSLKGDYADSQFLNRKISSLNLFDLANTAREYFFRIIDTHFSGDEAAILRGMLLSDKSKFSDAFSKALEESGMVHITVASGLHVNCVMAVLLWILFSCRVRKRYSYPLVIGILWGQCEIFSVNSNLL